jgi:hypothetical protein
MRFRAKMKRRPKVWIPVIGVLLLALSLAWWLPNRAPDVVVGLLGLESMPNSSPAMPNRLVLSVTNSGSTPIEVAVGPKKQRPDWPRGESAALSPGSGCYLHAWILSLDPPWMISIKSRRIAGKMEKWLRSYGVQLRLCDGTPAWRQVQLLEVNGNGMAIASAKDNP